MNGKSLARLLGALSLTLAVGHVAAAECVDLSPAPNVLPLTIDRPGSYCLTRSLIYGGTTGAAITITSDDVVLDLQGFQLSGSDFGNKTGIFALDRSNITIRNGSLTGFRAAAVNLASSTFPGAAIANVVEDLRLFNNGGSGINLSGRGGMVRRNLLVETGKSLPDSWAIGLLGTGHRVTGNEIVGVRKTAGSSGVSRGIWVNQCRDVLVLDNRITVADFGILYDASTGAIRDNLHSGVPSPYVILNGFGFADAGNNH